MTRTTKNRVIALAAAAGLATASIGALSYTRLTEAQENTQEYVKSNLAFTPLSFNIEGSIDGQNFNDTDPLTLNLVGGGTGDLSLRPGEANAVYQQYWVRIKAGSSTSLNAKANIQETGLPNTAFANSLRVSYYAGATTCDSSTTSGSPRLVDTRLRGNTIEGISLSSPTAEGQPGEAVPICIKTWMADDDWLNPGDPAPQVTATWTLTAQSETKQQ